MEILILSIFFICISRISSKLWFGSSNNWVGGWDVDTGLYQSPTWMAHSGSVSCIKFLTANTIVTGSWDTNLYVWDISSGTQSKTATFSGHSGNVNCCDKLLDGNVISGGDDKALYVWNPANGNTVVSQSNAHSTNILCLKVLANGNIATGAANGDTAIKIWSTSLGTPLKILYGHGNDVLVIDQLSNGNLISGSAEATSIIWNQTSGLLLNNIQPSSSSAAVNCLKELPDGNIAFAGGSSKAIYTWKFVGPAIQYLVGTSANIISTTPCKAMISYNNSLLAVASNGVSVYLVNMTNSTNLQLVTTLNSTLSSVTCFEIQDTSATTTTTTTTKLTTTTTTTTITTATITTTTTTTFTITTTTTKSTATMTNVLTTSIVTTTATTVSTTLFSNITINPNVFISDFILSDQTIEEYLALLNGNYDISDCIVNCSNHGLCKYVGNYSFVCACQGDYGGKTCQQNLLPCSQSPCLNNGTCYQNSTNLNQTEYSYYCECNALYYGTNCEHKIDVCQNETCSSNGVCKDVNSVPTCECFLNYYDNKCQSETSQQKTIKTVTSTATIIAIVFIVFFYSIVILNDIANYCIKPKKILLPKIKNMKPKQVAYIP